MRFFDNFEAFSKKTAVVDTDNNKYSYKDLLILCNNFSEKISSSDKQLILILCENKIEPIVAYIAALKTDNVAMLVDASINKSLLNKLINIYKPEYIWQPGENITNAIYEHRQYKLIKSNNHGSSHIHKGLGLLLSTSGTTGSPKLVRLKDSNIDSNAMSIAEYLELDSTHKPITTLPIHYSYGLSVINSHLLVGATLLLTNDSIMTKKFWSFFKSYSATSFAGVPYTYEILKKLRFFNMDLPGLRTMTQAGGKLAPETALEFVELSHKKGIDFYIMYGQTEATARISYLPPDKNIEKYRSIGIPIPGGDLSIIDNITGQVIKQPFIEGELVYRGENVMMGYANSRADLSKGDSLNGVLKTGDIAYFDNDGFFYITGREKRFIKIFGNRVNLDDIETFLREEDIDGICSGRDDLLCIAYTRPQKLTDIKKLITQKFGFHHSVVKVIKVNEIKRGSSGKAMCDEIFKLQGCEWK